MGFGGPDTPSATLSIGQTNKHGHCLQWRRLANCGARHPHESSFAINNFIIGPIFKLDFNCILNNLDFYGFSRVKNRNRQHVTIVWKSKRAVVLFSVYTISVAGVYGGG